MTSGRFSCHIFRQKKSDWITVTQSLLIFVNSGYRTLFYAEKRASAKVLDDLVIQLCRGDEELHIIYLAHEEFLPVEVELREHIVEEQHRRLVEHLSGDADLCQLERERYCALLSLRAVLLGVPSVDIKFYVVAVRTKACIAVIDIAVTIVVDLAVKYLASLRAGHEVAGSLVFDLQLLPAA